ncbi:MAG: sulfatase-like hydrolase/transferase [Bacteroidia bacterium]
MPKREYILSLTHLPLLGLFFVVFGWKESLYFFSLPQAFLFWLVCSSGMIALTFGLHMTVLRNLGKSSAIVSFAAIFFLHYSAIYKFLTEQPALTHWGRHRMLIPAFAVCWLLVVLYMRFRKTDSVRLILYLNVLFLVLTAGELFQTGWRYYEYADWWKSFHRKFISAPLTGSQFPRHIPPDIIHIITDAHTSPESVEKFWNQAKPPMPEELREKGFYLVSGARSNYDHTGQSVSSLFEMDSIELWKRMDVESHLSNGAVEAAIRNGKVPRLLAHNGYKIINFSFFDLPGAPASRENPFFTDPADTWDFLRAKTLWGKLRHDFLQKPSYESDQETLNQLKTISLRDYPSPVYMYVHLVIPHAPYFFDREGNLYPEGHLPGKADHEAYVEQLLYTDSQLQEIVGNLLRDTARQPVIIIQGDHGSRILPEKEKDLAERFTILNAWYFPNQDYRLLHDSMTSRETYPVLFEKYFAN